MNDEALETSQAELEALEISQAELEALEREPRRPKARIKKTPKRDTGKGQPRDELGRFTKPRKKK
jgi:hypothetical protein